MAEVIRKKGVAYCLLGHSMIRMDQLPTPLKDFAYTITQPNGEMEVPLE